MALDVHKATISVAVVNLAGKLVTQAFMQTDASAIRDFICGLSGTVHLTFEEGNHSQWLFDLARPLLAQLVVCNAKHASSHTYDSITTDTTRVMNRLKSLYTSHGIACSGRSVYYSRNRKLWLAKLTEEGHRLRAEFLYRQLDHLRPLKQDARKALLEEAKRHSAFKQLQMVPGLGPVRVAELIAAVGSPHRFSTKRQFWKYCGLAVLTRSSSDYEVVETGLQRRANTTQTRGLNRE